MFTGISDSEIIIFDEIDVGIGGGVAQVVGQLLNDLGKSKQVICITHQPLQLKSIHQL